jgi:hypothetical protein
VPEDVKQALIARKRKELSLDSCDKSVTSEGAHVPKVSLPLAVVLHYTALLYKLHEQKHTLNGIMGLHSVRA